MENNIYSYKLSELNIELESVAKLMDYTEEIPEHIVQTFNSEMARWLNNTEIRGGIATFKCDVLEEIISISDKNLKFHVGKKLTKLFAGSGQVSVFICTAGKTISDRSKELMDNGDFLEGYVVDVIGSVIVEKAMDNILEAHRSEMKQQNLNITNRYSPGYCEWNVADQKKLFSLFPKKFCGVSLTESCLMTPIKSVSGFIGIGQNVRFNQYSCQLCTLQNCIYRQKKR